MNERRDFGYRDLLVWKKGMSLAKQIYALTRTFPEGERFGLISQMRRAAVSVPSNIAEGQRRRTQRDFAQFLSHAEGSVAELDTQLTLAVEFGYCHREAVAGALATVVELEKMLASLHSKVEKEAAENRDGAQHRRQS